MKKLLLLSLLSPLLSFGQLKVNYQVHYSPNLKDDGLKVVLSFTSAKASDSTYFHFSNSKWGEDNLFNCLRILPNDNPNCSYRLVPDSNRIVFYHPKQKKISFTYRIKQDHDGKDNQVFNRPRVTDTYFHILGESLFSVPEAIFQGNSVESLDATIEWIGFPEKFLLHNTFGSKQTRQVLKVKLWEELYRALFVGGDFRHYEFMHQNKPVHFVIRDRWFTDEYQDEQLLAALKKTISTQRSFWNDTDFDYYTVIMSTTVTQADSLFKGQSTNGTGLKNGFMIVSSNNPYNNWEVMNYIFNHEMMHDWIGGKIKTKRDALNYWFSEGFTDYYTYKNRLRSGDLKAEEWVVRFNEDVIKAHCKNPKRDIPNYQIQDGFWNSREVEKVPYRRGAIFAFWLDNQLKLNNKNESLDDFMRELLAICSVENTFFTDELFLDLVEKKLNRDITYFFQKHIINGEPIDWSKEKLIDGVKMEVVDSVPQLVIREGFYNQYLQTKE